jgi:hypothetical protein
MNALRKTVEQKVSASASKQVAKSTAAMISTRRRIEFNGLDLDRAPVRVPTATWNKLTSKFP